MSYDNYNSGSFSVAQEPYATTASSQLAWGSRSESTSTPTLEYLIARAELLQKQIDQKLALQERWGENDDYDHETIIVAERRFQPRGILYTYVFLKCAPNSAAGRAKSWYSTAKSETGGASHTMSWEQVREFLDRSEKVWLVTHMREM